MLHDVFDNVVRRVENTARFLHFGLVFNLCLVPVRQPDYFAEELLVHVPENSGRDKRKLVLAVGEVEAFYYPFQDLVINRDGERERVRGFVPIRFLLEVEEPGVVFVVGKAEDLAEPP